jgi:hypothetical protein
MRVRRIGYLGAAFAVDDVGAADDEVRAAGLETIGEFVRAHDDRVYVLMQTP